MRTIKRIVLLLALATALLAFNLPCPIDGTSAYFTGYSKTDPPSGKLLKLYRSRAVTTSGRFSGMPV